MRIRNSITIIGRIGQEPEHRALESGAEVCKISVATSERYNNKQGESVEETQWHTVIAWGKLAEIIKNYSARGQEVAVRGKMTYRKWEDKDGNARVSAEIIAQDFLILSGRDKNGAAPAQQAPLATKAPQADDDLPF